MAGLIEHRAVLTLDPTHPNPTYSEGARFVGPLANHPKVTVELVRWMQMGSPRTITVTITPGGIDDRKPIVR